MAEFLLTGRDPGGNKVTVRIEADSPGEAVRIAGEDGLREIALHTDAAGSRARGPRGLMTPRDLLSGLVGLLIVAGLILIFVAVVRVARRAQMSGQYDDLIEAASWGRWEDVLRLSDGFGGQVPPEELAFRKARALVGLGRVDEALKLVEPFGDGQAMPEWLFQSRMPEVYRPAKRPEAAKAAVDRSLELAPDNAAVLIDAAQAYAWHSHDPRRASELLEKARTQSLGDLARPFAARVEGLIRLEEGRPREAIPLLEDASRQFLAVRDSSPLVPLVLDMLHAEQAVACAEAGDVEAARRHFRLALPRLRALGHDETIARCRRAIGAEVR